MALDTPSDVAADAVARLLDAQMPWGEWGAVGESPEARNPQRMRTEQRHNPIPKANVFRTVVAIESLQSGHDTPCVATAIAHGTEWLRVGLFHSVHPRAPDRGVWTAHVAIPAGIGPSLEVSDLVKLVDLRHTSQAWSALLWRNGIDANDEPALSGAATCVLEAADHNLWGNIEGSERPNNFASACCLSFLHCAVPRLPHRHDITAALRRACQLLRPRLEDALQPSFTPQAAEETGRSLWIIGRSGLQSAFRSLEPAVRNCLRTLLNEETCASYRAAIRLTAAAQVFGWSAVTGFGNSAEWLLNGYGRHRSALHPPDLAFVILAASPNTITGIERQRDKARRTSILSAALQERLQLLIWLETVKSELAVDALRVEQHRYIEKLTSDEDLQQWAYLGHDIGSGNWRALNHALERLEVFRLRLLEGRDLAKPDFSRANREIIAELHKIEGREIRAFIGRILTACWFLREFHLGTRFPRDLLAKEEHVKSFLALELAALGFHLIAFEPVVSSGRIDFVFQDVAGSPLQMIAECKLVRDKTKLEQQRTEAVAKARRWAATQSRKIRKSAERGKAQVIRYPGQCCRIVFICCLFEEDRKVAVAEDGFHTDLYREGDLELPIVWMNLYFWMEAAGRSAIRHSSAAPKSDSPAPPRRTPRHARSRLRS